VTDVFPLHLPPILKRFDLGTCLEKKQNYPSENHSIIHQQIIRGDHMGYVFGLFVVLAVGTSSTIAQWSQQVNGLSDWAVTSLYADTATLYAGTSSQVFKSTDLGSSWFVSSSGLPAATGFNSIVRSGSFLIAGGNSVGIWRSSNNGGTWVQTTSGVASNEYVSSFVVEGNTVYGAFGFPSSVGNSTDNGATWTKTSNGLQSTQYMTGVARIGSNLFACHAALGVYISTNNGASWSLAGAIGAQNKNALIASSSSLIVVSTGGVATQNAIHHSTDLGATWTRVRSGPRMFGLSKIGATLYAVGDSLFRSTDNGLNWTALDLTGWPGTAVWNTLQIAGTYAFVNFYGIGVYRRLASQLVAVRETQGIGLPTEFRLEQNYPNPFNPATRISFSVRGSGFVSLKVYDLLGREVRTLVSENLHPGSYEVTFDASGLASGIYYYRLTAGEFTQSKRMMLLR
jgi:hypothetical protein